MGFLGRGMGAGIGAGLNQASRGFLDAVMWGRERQEREAQQDMMRKLYQAQIDRMAAETKEKENEQARLDEYRNATRGPEIMGLMSDGMSVPAGQFSVDSSLDAPRGTGQYAGVSLPERVKAYSKAFPKEGLKYEVDLAAAEQKQPPIVKQLIDAAQNGSLTPEGEAVLKMYGYGGMFTRKPERLPNIPGEVDYALAKRFKGYATDPIVYKQAMEWLATPEGGKWADEQVATLSRSKAPPIYNFVQTDQGIVPGDIRTGGMGKPTAGPGGDAYKKPIPSEQIASLQQAKTLEDAVTAAENYYDPAFVGPIAGRIAAFNRQYTGGYGQSSAQIKFNSALEEARNSLVYLLSGKQINETEFERLNKQLPNVNMTPVAFTAAMTRFKETMGSIIGRKKEMLEAGGYGSGNAPNSNLPPFDMKLPLGASPAREAKNLTKNPQKTVVERRRSKSGRMMVKYADGSIGYE